MGVDLMGVGLDYNWGSWRALHALGVAFGWKPAGTLKPIDPETYETSYPPDDYPGPPGGYFNNNLYLVTDADAAAWAAALFRALSSEANKVAAKQILDLTDAENEAWVREFADAASQHGFCIT